MRAKLMKARAWAKREFDTHSLPCSLTIKKWVESGTIDGRIIDGHTYVFSDQSAGLNNAVNQAVQALLRS